MRSAMDEKTFLDFYKNTMFSYSNNVQRYVCKWLEKEHRITFDAQVSIGDSSDTMFFESKKDFKGIISKTTTNLAFVKFYEQFEFKKLYKYSVPFFFEMNGDTTVKEILTQQDITIFDSSYTADYIIDSTLKEAKPLAYIDGDKIFLKFTLQKVYMDAESYDKIDYRYPIIIYIDTSLKILEVRYDSIKFGENVDRDYSKIVNSCVTWIQENLCMNLFVCEHSDAIKVIND